MLRLSLFASIAFLLVACGGGESSHDTAASIPEDETATTGDVLGAEDPPNLGPAEAFIGLDGWLQSDIESLGDLKGKVVVVQFWTFGCHNCKATLPYLQELYANHADDQFEIVGVHSPEFDYEKDPAAITEAAQTLGVTWPIALDTNKRNFRHWQGSPAYWPRTYVLDQDGNIRFDHIGEGKYEELAETVAALLG